jgi:6-phosphogluconolactonase
VTDPEVIRFQDADELVGQVGRRLLGLLTEVQLRDEVPSVALTGGSIADRVHQEVARLSNGSSVDWSRVDLWWGDERFVPADSPDRNVGQARAALLDHVGVDPARIHEVPAAGTMSLDEAAAAYGDELRAHGGGLFDVVFLGIGPDGHIASLFPGRPELDVEDAITLPVSGSPKPPPERVTLTFGALNRTREVWFIVSGSDKAEAVASALGGADLHDTPAAGVRGQEKTLWFVDEAAAGRLG